MSTLVLSGWAQPADALANLADDPVLFDYSDYPSPEAAIAALRGVEATDCIGWSLGGQLALWAIAAGAIGPRHLTLIAAPFRFVGAGGMGPETFSLFRASYVADSARTQSRFNALIAKGDRDFKRVHAALSSHRDAANTARWLPWLDALAATSLTEVPLAHTPPTLIIHGMHDAIVPHAQSDRLLAAIPTAARQSWPETGHAPHLHDAPCLRAQIAAHRAAA